MASSLTRALWRTKAAIRDGLRWSLWHSSLARRLGPVLAAHRRMVLTYHTVGQPSPVVNPANMLPPTTFERHLELIGRAGRPIVPLAQLLDHERSLPRGGVALTFDDGYRGCLHEVAPRLEAIGATATFFVSPGFIDGADGKWDDLVTLELPGFSKRLLRRPRAEVDQAVASARTRAGERIVDYRDALLGWAQLRELKSRGFTIQSHTSNHYFLGALDDAHLERELADAKARIDAELDQDTEILAYPFGFPGCFDERCRRLAEATGHRNALALGNRYVRPDGNPFAVPRFGLSTTTPDWQLELILSGGWLR